jgi:hypothetical protein
MIQPAPPPAGPEPLGVILDRVLAEMDAAYLARYGRPPAPSPRLRRTLEEALVLLAEDPRWAWTGRWVRLGAIVVRAGGRVWQARSCDEEAQEGAEEPGPDPAAADHDNRVDEAEHGDSFRVVGLRETALEEQRDGPFRVVFTNYSRPLLGAAHAAGENADDYSRMLPFRGYVFKEFSENAAPASVFADFPMQENLDGEAVLWALQRLARRRERTKVCIVLCDGLPAAMFSRRDELERHLYTVCRHADSRAREGLHLAAIGIGEERVKEFYANAAVLRDVADLPRAVLWIVERILGKAGMG